MDAVVDELFQDFLELHRNGPNFARVLPCLAQAAVHRGADGINRRRGGRRRVATGVLQHPLHGPHFLK